MNVKPWPFMAGALGPALPQVSEQEQRAEFMARAGLAMGALFRIRGIVNAMNAQLDDEDQPGGPQCPTGDTFNDLCSAIRGALIDAGIDPNPEKGTPQ